MSNPFEFETSPTPKPTTDSGRMFLIGCGLGVVTVGVLVAGFLIYFLPIAQLGGSTKNRDYFKILELKYENAAVIKLKIVWLREFPRAFQRHIWRESDRFVQPVLDQSDLASDLIERQIVAKRKDFITDHGIESSVWKETFKKEFPLRDVIFDEIEQETEVIARRQVADSQSHFTKSFTQLINDPGRCIDYFRNQAPKFVEEVRAKARNLPSVKSLRSKVFK